MKNSATNTAARELLPCPFCGAQIGTHVGHADIQYFGCDPAMGGCGAVVSFAPRKIGGAAFDAWDKRTQQQGEQEADVEQQARELLAATYRAANMPNMADVFLSKPWDEFRTDDACALDAIVAALRTKQPAASVGDMVVVPRTPTRRMTGAGQAEANKWPAVGRGISELGVIACWNAMLAELPTAASNTTQQPTEDTSKQAAGEAVAVARVQCSSQGPHGTLYAMLVPKGPRTPEVKEGDALYLHPPCHPAYEEVHDGYHEGYCPKCDAVLAAKAGTP